MAEITESKSMFCLHAAARYRRCEIIAFGGSIEYIVKAFLTWRDKHKVRTEHIAYAYVFVIPEDIHYANLQVRDDGGVNVVPAPEDSKLTPRRRHHKTAFGRWVFGQ